GTWILTHVLLRDSSSWKVFSTDSVVREDRHADYAFKLAVDAPAAKEIRTFGLASWSVERVAAGRRRVVEASMRDQRLRQGSIRRGLLMGLAANGPAFWSPARDPTPGAPALS